MTLKRNRQGNLVGTIVRECASCGELFLYFNRNRTQCAICKMLSGARYRAEMKNMDFDLCKKDIDIPKYCPILGIKLMFHYGESRQFPDTPSLDRINNDIGYIPNNIWVISSLANTMKSNANVEQLCMFSDWIRNEYT